MFKKAVDGVRVRIRKGTEPPKKEQQEKKEEPTADMPEPLAELVSKAEGKSETEEEKIEEPARGWLVLGRKEKKDSVKRQKRDWSALFSGRLSIKDQTLFAKRLSFLIGAGVPVLDSLHVLVDQTHARGTKKMLKRAAEDVANGRFLSAALTRFKHHFGEFAINIIKVGESSGTLAQNLNHLATELEKKETLRKKMVSALVYPIFITIATFGLAGVLTVYIFPKILPIFSSLAVDLPWTTHTLLVVSTFLRQYGLLTLGVLVVLLVVFVIVRRRSDAFRLFSDRFLLRVPLIGRMVQYYNMANITRTLGLLLKSGVVVVSALETTAETTQNRVYRRELVRASEHTHGGERISEHFKRHPGLFPPILAHMVSIGERTGNLSDTLVYLSDYYEVEIDSITKNFSSLVEPVLMIVMGLVVGFVAVSVITPIYNITQTLSNGI